MSDESTKTVRAGMVAEYAELLHQPDRMQCLRDLEEHLTTSARLARAIWEMFCNDGMDCEDRTRYAAMELAHVLADHTSAALLVFYKDDYADATWRERAREEGRREGMAEERAKSSKTSMDIAPDAK